MTNQKFNMIWYKCLKVKIHYKCKFEVCNFAIILINSFQFKRTLIFLFIFLIIKKPYSKYSDLNFFLKWCCKISIMQFYRLFKKIIWKDIYVLQDDFINKALPFAKLSPWVCWWIWIFLSLLIKFHVSDFIPNGTLCTAQI